MLDVKVLGGGCNNCKVTASLLEGVALDMKVKINLEKVEDIQDIMAYDVISTPGVVINGKVVHRGSVPSRQQVERWLSAK
jgi:predicted thioredoxin/glutaredoxin